MKKSLIGVLVLVVGLLLLTSCLNKGSEETLHTHSYSEQVVAPTCTAESYTLHTCICGDNYKDNVKAALGHNWIEGEKNYYCSRCNQSEAEGFSFQLATMDGESCYTITNATAKAVVNGVLEVPRKYESLPVRGIMNWSFSAVTKQVKTIIIHDNIKSISSDLWHGTSIWNPDWDTMSTLTEIKFDSTCRGLRVEAGAFNNCPSLAKANIQAGMIKYVPADTVTTSNGGTGEYIFKGTPYFKNYAVEKSGLYYIADLLLYANLNEVSSTITIDSGTVWINPCLFNKCTTLKSVTIPSSVTTIGGKAFQGCSSLETITFKGTVAQFQQLTIGSSAFSGTKAKKVTCSDGTVTSYTYNGYTYQIGD